MILVSNNEDNKNVINLYSTYIQSSVLVHLGVWLFDGFPTFMIAVGIATQLTYSLLLRTFPFISIASPAFLLGCGKSHNAKICDTMPFFLVLLLLHHYLTFNHFTENLYTFQEASVSFVHAVLRAFIQVFAFFVLGLWMVPFAFFVSISAGDNVLPTYSPGPLSDPGE